VSDLDSRKRTPIHIAASSGHSDVLSHLIGVDKSSVDSLDTKDKTALFLACKHSRSECAKLLLKSKANPNALARGGLTPLHVCVLGSGEGVVELTKALISEGADVNKADTNLVTPLHNAGTPSSYCPSSSSSSSLTSSVLSSPPSSLPSSFFSLCLPYSPPLLSLHLLPSLLVFSPSSFPSSSCHLFTLYWPSFCRRLRNRQSFNFQ